MMENTQEIVEFAKDRIEQLYDEYRGAAPGEYDPQVIGGVISITRHMLDSAVKFEALDVLRHVGIDNDDVIRDVFEAILQA